MHSPGNKLWQDSSLDSLGSNRVKVLVDIADVSSRVDLGTIQGRTSYNALAEHSVFIDSGRAGCGRGASMFLRRKLSAVPVGLRPA